VPACTACHSPKGKGNSPAGYPLLSGQQSDYIAKALKNYRTGERNNDESSQMMMAIAYKLDDVEIDALSSFINGLH
jgi:cytochrome c553